MELVVEVYEATKTFPSEEKFGLVSQMRRAAVSIPANIAEGWGRGAGQAGLQFVRIARGSSHELNCLCDLSKRLGFLDVNQMKSLEEKLGRSGRLIQAYLKSMERRLSISTNSPTE